MKAARFNKTKEKLAKEHALDQVAKNQEEDVNDKESSVGSDAWTLMNRDEKRKHRQKIKRKETRRRVLIEQIENTQELCNDMKLDAKTRGEKGTKLANQKARLAELDGQLTALKAVMIRGGDAGDEEVDEEEAEGGANSATKSAEKSANQSPNQAQNNKKNRGKK